MIRQTKLQLRHYLQQINQIEGSEVSLIQIQKMFVVKELQIYNQLNRFKSGEKLLLGLIWCPTKYS